MLMYKLGQYISVDEKIAEHEGKLLLIALPLFALLYIACLMRLVALKMNSRFILLENGTSL